MDSPGIAKTFDLETVNLTPRIGTEVKADVETLISGVYAKGIRELLEQRGVLVFRNVPMTNEQQYAFSQTLGTVQSRSGEIWEKITLDTMVSQSAEYLKGSVYWHIDGATDGTPNLAALLGARQLAPPGGGGETLFANTYAAWDDLPEDDKKELDGLRVVHSIEAAQLPVYPQPTYKQRKAWYDFGVRVNPLVWTHRSGRKSLVLGATADHIEGMPERDGRLLLTKLLDFATQPERVYRHEWQMGDIIMWDNTGTMHRVEPYDPACGRLMARNTLMGEEPLV